MNWLIEKLAGQPVIVGNVVKAVLALAALFGLAVTDAQGEAIAGVVAALLVFMATITVGEQQRVTPVKKVAQLIDKPERETNALLRGIRKVLP